MNEEEIIKGIMILILLGMFIWTLIGMPIALCFDWIGNDPGCFL